MKKLLFLFISILVLSCSKDDSCDQEVTGTQVEEIKTVNPAYPPNNVNYYTFNYKYYITLDHGDRIETNKATVDFYKGRGVVCFEGYK